MLEVVVLFLLVIAAGTVLPSFVKSCVRDQSIYLEQIKIPEDSMLRRHFLTHLQSEIEAALHSCPDDVVLQRHYHALVASKCKS